MVRRKGKGRMKGKSSLPATRCSRAVQGEGKRRKKRKEETRASNERRGTRREGERSLAPDV